MAALPRSSSSSSSRPLPNPPPHHPTASYATPPPNHRGADPSDPFLAQSRDIALTERDRQEGYDVELLNARPRGNSSRRLAEKGTDGGEYPMYEKGGAGGGGYGAGALGAGAAGGSLREGPPRRRTFGAGGDRGDGRKWYLRPLALAIILGLLLAVALALGLGVGLSEAHKNRNKSADEDNSAAGNKTAGSSDSAAAGGGGGSSSRVAAMTKNATASIFTATGTETTSAGTVIPSSLYTDLPSTSSFASSEIAAASGSAASIDSLFPSSSDLPITITSTESSPFPTAFASTSASAIAPASGTTRASTGNLPIPANSATTLGTEVISVVTPLGGTDRARVRCRG